LVSTSAVIDFAATVARWHLRINLADAGLLRQFPSRTHQISLEPQDLPRETPIAMLDKSTIDSLLDGKVVRKRVG
jgi:hypothetical protein